MSERNLGSFLVGLGVGALIGAGATMLSTPWSGRETRGKVRGAWKKGVDRVEDGYGSVRERAREIVSRS